MKVNKEPVVFKQAPRVALPYRRAGLGEENHRLACVAIAIMSDFNDLFYVAPQNPPLDQSWIHKVLVREE